MLTRFAKSTGAKRLLVISALLFWCSSLVAVRVERTGSNHYRFLVGNLVLAAVPLMFSTLLRIINRRGWPIALQLVCFGLWLLFLPNAPYLLTDLLHLTAPSTGPGWYDVAMLVSCSGTGVLLGYLSLTDVHAFMAQKVGPLFGWSLALSSMALAGFAMYLGRFLRWNSWDVIVNPSRFIDIAAGLQDPMAHSLSLAVTFTFGTMFVLGYVAIRVLITGTSTERGGEFAVKQSVGSYCDEE